MTQVFIRQFSHCNKALIILFVVAQPFAYAQNLPQPEPGMSYNNDVEMREELKQREEDELKRQKIIQEARLQLELSKKKNSVREKTP